MNKTTLLTSMLAIATAMGAQAEIIFKGDLRLRGEIIDQDGKENRERFRVRARVTGSGQVNDNISATVGLASGGSDPVSTNQSFDGSGSSKGLQLNLAYLTYSADAGSVTAGKMKNPFRKVSDLLWDGDLTPEGIAVNTGSDLVGLDLGVFALEERSSSDDTYMYGAQVTVSPEVSEGIGLTLGASFFLYDNIQGFGALYDDDLFGNTGTTVTDADGEESELFASEYALAEGFIKLDLGAIDLFADYVVNTDASTSDDTGYQVGVKVQASKAMKFAYYWRMLEADAVLGTWTDSDFGGGGTDSEGHKLSAEVKLAENLSTALSVFVNEQGLEGEGTDYNRVQLDLKAKF